MVNSAELTSLEVQQILCLPVERRASALATRGHWFDRMINRLAANPATREM